MSSSIMRAVTAATFALFVSSVAMAQTLTVTPGPVLPRGGNATISYEDPTRAGLQIAIVITGGFPEGSTTVTITLDNTGKGSFDWTVPNGWRNASFNAPGCQQQTFPIG